MGLKLKYILIRLSDSLMWFFSDYRHRANAKETNYEALALHFK